MKTLTNFINEAKNVRVYPEDWKDISDATGVIDCIILTLEDCGMIDSLAESIEKGLDPHIFTDKKFLESFGKKLSIKVLEKYNDLFE